jgi:pyrroloquinoline quinone biosynthesis protein B
VISPHEPRSTSRSAAILSLAVLLSIAVGCTEEPRREADAVAPPAERNDAPRLVALGIAQDGGFPHAACECSHCDRARSRPQAARLIASLALLLPSPNRMYLVDATPDIRPQLDRLRALRRATGDRLDRSPVDGVFLTHAHLGHYTGLAFFGYESIHTTDIPVFCTSSMAEYLENNGPWSQLVRLNNVELSPMGHGRAVDLGGGVAVTAIQVPHRDEYADTVGFIFRGPMRSVLYVPDTDSWSAWSPSLVETLEGIDVAILDATFFSTAELPGRDVSKIGHPLVTASMDLLEPLVKNGSLEVYFTHLNHSNPAIFPDSPENEQIERRGFAVLTEGQEIPL